MSLHPIGICKISRWTEKYPCHVRELAEWEVCEQDAYKKQVDVKENTYSLRDGWTEFG